MLDEKLREYVKGKIGWEDFDYAITDFCGPDRVPDEQFQKLRASYMRARQRLMEDE